MTVLKKDVINAAKTLKSYWDSTKVFGCGCMKHPLTYVCESIHIYVMCEEFRK